MLLSSPASWLKLVGLARRGLVAGCSVGELMPLPSNPPGFYRSATADGEPSCEDFWTLVVTPFGRRGIGLHHHRCIRTHTVIHLEVSILLPFLPLSAKRGGEKSFPFPFPSPPFLSALFFFRARSNYIAERWSSAKRGKKLPKKKMLHFATCGGNLVTLRRFCKKKTKYCSIWTRIRPPPRFAPMRIAHLSFVAQR